LEVAPEVVGIFASDAEPQQPRSQEPEARPVAVTPVQDATTLWSTEARSSARLLVSDGPLELWSWTLQPGDRRDSEPHRPGSFELLTVQTGTVALDVCDHHAEIPAGDSAWFDATWPHAYANPAATAATFTLVVLDPARPPHLPAAGAIRALDARVSVGVLAAAFGAA
jgi:quercetin dioxygenase-like cupin family protein